MWSSQSVEQERFLRRCRTGSYTPCHSHLPFLSRSTSMTRLKQLIHEVHRRSLWQVVGLYAAGAWLCYQVVLGIVDGVGLPDWVPPLAIVLFLIGLPIVVATAFVQEGGPSREDFRREEPAASANLAEPPGIVRRTLTWPRALVGGVLAFALLGMGTSTYMAMRVLGIGPPGSLMAAGVIDERDQILIADFRSIAGDTALAAVVSESFRVDLGRSTLVRVVTSADVREALQRMHRSDVRVVDAELAREIAVREGIKAVLEGEVATAAGAYVLTARLVAAASGDVLATHRESARDSTKLLDAIDRLTRKLRARTGESLREVNSATPLAQVITPSLDALRKFSDAMRASAFEGDPAKARRLLEEAVALDSAFASAHRALAVHHGNNGRYDLAVEATERALRFPERLTERERFMATAAKHLYHREHAQAIAVYEAMLSRFPDDRAALNNIALLFGDVGDLPRAISYYQKAIAVDTSSFFSYTNLGETYVRAGDFERARSTFQQAVARAPNAGWPVVNLAMVPAAAADFATAETALRAIIADTASTRQVVMRAQTRLASVVMAQGRLRESAQITEQRMRAAGNPDPDLVLAMDRLALDIFTFRDVERARAAAAAMLPRLLQLQPRADALIEAATLFAFIEPPYAHTLLDKYATVEQRAQPWADPRVPIAEGMLRLAHNDVAGAIAHMRRGRDRLCLGCEEIFIAHAFERAQQPDSVAAAYKRYLAETSTDRHWVDRIVIGSVHERLAQLAERRGDLAEARTYYQHLMQLWAKADPELQPRVAAARDRLIRLAADRQ